MRPRHRMLTRTEIFEFGEMPPKRQVQAFNVVFEQPDAARRFQRIGKNAQPSGRLSAVAGLLLLDHSAAEHLLVVLSNSPERILMFDSSAGSSRQRMKPRDIRISSWSAMRSGAERELTPDDGGIGIVDQALRQQTREPEGSAAVSSWPRPRSRRRCSWRRLCS